MNDKNIKISVSDNLKEDAVKIFEDYKNFWLHMLSIGKYVPIEVGIKIVKAFDEVYIHYSWFEKRFISEWLTFDFINSFEKEHWFNRFLCANGKLKYEPRSFHDSDMFAELIYGGIPPKFPLVAEASRNRLTEEEGQKLYDEFWQKTINTLKKQ